MTNRNTEKKVDEQISDLALDAVVGGTSIKKIGGVAWDQLKSSAHMFLGGSEEILGELVGQFTFIPGAHERGTEWTHTGEGRWMEGVKEGQQASHLEGDDAATTILGTFLSTAAGAGIGELGGTIIGKVTDPMLSSVYERLTDGVTGVPEAAPPHFSQIDGQINDVLSNLDEGSGLGHEHEAILRKLNESSVERLKNLLNNEARLDIRMANDEADHLAEHSLEPLAGTGVEVQWDRRPGRGRRRHVH